MRSGRRIKGALAIVFLTREGLSFSPEVKPSKKCIAGDLDWAKLSRRSLISSLFIASPAAVLAVAPPPRNIIDVGGGFDLRSGNSLSNKDVVFPPSMEGLWNFERVVMQSEGDSYQAEVAWRSLGGASKPFNRPESYQTRFVKSALIGDSGVVLDRSFDIQSRSGNLNVRWSADAPDTVQSDKINLLVVQRSVELPSDNGFGSNELFRIQEGPFERACQVKRRFRRAFDADGNRVVEGLEIMKTFRVLDGVAGTEMPTSTTKSQIRLTRP
jgi:hypothetical protein